MRSKASWLSLFFFLIPFRCHASDVIQPVNVQVAASISVKNFPAYQAVVGTVAVSDVPLSTFKNVSLSTTPVQVKASACDLWAFYLYNKSAAGNEISVKFFNRATAPVVGTTPSDLTITIAGKSSAPQSFPHAVSFPNGLWILATTGSGDASPTPPAAEIVIVNLFFR